MNSGAASLFIALALCTATAVLNGTDALEDSFDNTYTLPPDATINITNTDGSIHFYAADVSDIHVHATKHAYTSERLEGIKIDARVDAKSLNIDTTYPPLPNKWSFRDRSGTVDYIIIVPMSTRITRCDLTNGEILIEGLQQGSAKAHLVNGWLAAHNSFADLDFSLVNGRLDFAYDWWQDKAFTGTARSEKGNIRMALPPSANVSIDAESKSGKIANHFDDDDANHDDNARRFTATIGSGDAGAHIQLRSDEGNIRIDKSY